MERMESDTDYHFGLIGFRDSTTTAKRASNRSWWGDVVCGLGFVCWLLGGSEGTEKSMKTTIPYRGYYRDPFLHPLRTTSNHGFPFNHTTPLGSPLFTRN